MQPANKGESIATGHPRAIDAIRFGLGVRALRRRRGLTQQQLATRSRVSRAVIWRIERGSADRVAVRTLADVVAALDARIELRLLWHGEHLDRLLDSGHARLVELVVTLLTTHGWDAATEVSFNIRGERGAVDVLAFHRPTASLLVIEVKSVVPDIQAMLAGLDRKGRLARAIASDRGWAAAAVARVLVLPDDRTARRRIAAHGATIGAALPARTAAVKVWIRTPASSCPGHGVMFLTDAPHASQRPPIRGHRARPGGG